MLGIAWQHWALIYWLCGAAYLIYDDWREGNGTSLGDIIVMLIFGGIFAPLLLWEKLPGKVLKIARNIGNIQILKPRR